MGADGSASEPWRAVARAQDRVVLSEREEVDLVIRGGGPAGLGAAESLGATGPRRARGRRSPEVQMNSGMPSIDRSRVTASRSGSGRLRRPRRTWRAELTLFRAARLRPRDAPRAPSLQSPRRATGPRRSPWAAATRRLAPRGRGLRRTCRAAPLPIPGRRERDWRDRRSLLRRLSGQALAAQAPGGLSARSLDA